MFSRVKEGFKSTVTNIGSALGNPLIREYEIGNQLASGGTGLSWKIYEGKKRSTNQEVSIWLFEKRQFDKMVKRDQQVIFDTLKRGVQQLTRLRHPKLLIVEHGIEESRDSLAFATEPVFASLSNILGSHFNLPTPVPGDLKEYELFEVELKYGLLQITEGLTFLHNDVKMIHGNICPDNVILNKIGAWKLAGFDCCMVNNTPTEQEPKYTFSGWDPDAPIPAKPSLDFLAPEYVLSQTADRHSDMFSLGMIFYTVFNRGRSLYECDHVLSTFQKNCLQLGSLNATVFRCLPDDVRDHVKMLLSLEPDVRPDADQLAKIPFFQDVGAATLQYLDTLFQWDKSQRISFYKGLKKVLEKLPQRVLLQRVLPSIVPELANQEMVLFVLPNVLYIAEQCSKDEYVNKILPHLKGVFLMAEPIQIIYICVQKMDLLISKTPLEDVRSHVFPMLYKALDSTDIKIQELCLKVIPSFAQHVDFPTMKNQVVPRLKRMCLETSLLSVRVNSLVCLGKILEFLDKWYIQDDVLPFTASIPSHEPGVLMAILGIYQVTMTHKKLGMSKDVMATRGVPYLLPLAIDSQLNLNQFRKFMNVIQEMIKQIETEHLTKLEQVNAYEREQNQAMEQVLNGDGSELSADAVFSSILDQKTDMKKISAGIDDIFGDGPSTSVHSSPEKVSKDTKNLTIEQKQKLMKDKETMKKLEKQGPIQAATVTPKSTSSSTSATKDLTSSLAAMTMPQPTPLGGSTYTNGSGMGMGGGPNYNMEPQFTAPMNLSGKPNYMLGPQPTPGNSMVIHPMSQQMHQSSFSGMGMGGMGMQPQPGMNMQSQQPVNMSALDSLNVLPGGSKFPTPQNRPMMGQPRPPSGGQGFMTPGAPGQMTQPGLRPLNTPQFSPQFAMNMQQQRQPTPAAPLSSNDIDSLLN